MAQEQPQRRPLLQDVVVIRPTAIVLLVLMHAFTMFAGNWPPVETYRPVAAYWWVAKAAYSFMLEIFVFISGYLFAYQQLERNRPASLRRIAGSKLRRLVLPSAVFSVLYLLCFRPVASLSPADLYDVVEGEGHMWFLPMLFWCFVLCRALTAWGGAERRKFALLLILALLSGISLPLQLDKACYYLLFFYGGYAVRQHREELLVRYAHPRCILLMSALFVGLFIAGSLLIRHLDTLPAASYLARKGVAAARCAVMIPYAAAGIAATWLLVNRMVRSRRLPEWLATANAYCFAVYIFHQFLLKALYYHTALPEATGIYALPFAGFAAALAGSFLLAYPTLRTRAGRYLLG